MGETKSFCRKCKAQVDFIVRDEMLECPACGQQYAKSEIAPGWKDEAKGCLKVFVVFILVLLGLVLLALAFLYAACSHMNI
jgi:hypothetical protein